MNLLVDLGNSRVKWALQGGPTGGRTDQVAIAWRGEPLGAVLERCWGGLVAPERVCVSTVASEPLCEELRGWVRVRWALEAVFARSRASACGVRSAYSRPERLGVDRFLALIGARALVSGPCCVVDGGTALTIDAMDAGGQHLGGVIAPGIATMRRSLATDTFGIREVEAPPGLGLANSTGAAVVAGTLGAAVGLVERVRTSLVTHFGHPPECLLTGGDAGTLQGLLGFATKRHDDLVLHGLSLYTGETP